MLPAAKETSRLSPICSQDLAAVSWRHKGDSLKTEWNKKRVSFIRSPPPCYNAKIISQQNPSQSERESLSRRESPGMLARAQVFLRKPAGVSPQTHSGPGEL